MEVKILAAFMADRSAYNKLQQFVGKDTFSDKADIIYKEIAEYYGLDEDAHNVDKNIIYSRIERKYPKHSEIFRKLFNGLEPVSVPNVEKEFIEMLRKNRGQALAEALVSENDKAIPDLLDKYNRVNDLGELITDGQDRKTLCGASAAELLEVYSKDNLIPIYPSALNERIGGGAPKGAHIFFYAVPEMGKTLTAVNMLAGIGNAGYKALYVGNEDPIKLINLRLLTRLAKMTKQEIIQDPVRADELAGGRGYGNVVFEELAPGSISDISDMIDEHEPDVVILDQLTNLNASRNLAKTEKYEYLAYQYRMLVKRKNVLGISFAQAGDSAEGKAILERNDVYYSNTGIPAQCDVMVGLGGTQEDERMNRRWLSLPKNKLSGDHEPIPVMINPVYSMMRGV